MGGMGAGGAEGGLVLKRGAAQLALRAGAPVVCVRERLSRRILAKGQKPWDMGTERVVFSFDAAAPIAPASFPQASSSRVAASELTEMIRRHLPDSGRLW